MPVGCNKQMSAIKEGVIMRLQCFLFEAQALIFIVVYRHLFDLQSSARKKKCCIVIVVLVIVAIIVIVLAVTLSPVCIHPKLID